MNFRRFLCFILVILAGSGFYFPANAQHEVHEAEHVTDGHAEASGHEEEKGLNVSKIIFGHVGDSHSWHITDFNGHAIALPLPVIVYHPEKGLSVFSSARFEHGHASYDGYRLEFGPIKEKIVSEDGAKILDFSITKNVLAMFLSILILFLLVNAAMKKYKKYGAMKAPSGIQNFLEVIVIFIRDEVAKPYLGNKWQKFFPLLITIFFFIWINNMLGLLPFGFNFTGNIAVTACLALISFVVILAYSNKHFWGHLFNPPGVPMGIKFLLVPIEILSLFIKPMALMIRLFANMIAGHIMILAVISMIFIFAALNKFAGIGFAPVSLAFSIFMFLIEVLVAAIQAFIFANLTAVFIGQSLEEPEHHIEDSHPIEIKEGH